MVECRKAQGKLHPHSVQRQRVRSCWRPHPLRWLDALLRFSAGTGLQHEADLEAHQQVQLSVAEPPAADPQLQQAEAAGVHAEREADTFSVAASEVGGQAEGSSAGPGPQLAHVCEPGVRAQTPDVSLRTLAPHAKSDQVTAAPSSPVEQAHAPAGSRGRQQENCGDGSSPTGERAAEAAVGRLPLSSMQESAVALPVMSPMLFKAERAQGELQNLCGRAQSELHRASCTTFCERAQGELHNVVWKRSCAGSTVR